MKLCESLIVNWLRSAVVPLKLSFFSGVSMVGEHLLNIFDSRKKVNVNDLKYQIKVLNLKLFNSKFNFFFFFFFFFFTYCVGVKYENSKKKLILSK